MSSISSSSSEDEYDPREALSQIDADLTHLEHILQPLLEGAQGTWNDVLDHLGNMEQAKMGMIVAYGVCDLIWIFLRLKGIDPSSHPVMKELDRIKTYYIKVRDAENPPKKANKVDVAAAGRFVAAAIPRAQRLDALTSTSAAAASEDGETTSSRANTPAPAPEEEVREVGKHSRFKIAHASVPERLQKGGGERFEKEEIEVVQGIKEAPAVSRRKGKRVAAEDFLDSPPPPPAPAGSGSGSEGTTTKRAKTDAKSAATATSTSPTVEGAAASGGKTRRAARKSTNSKRS